jgi:hypothetical protein
MADTPSTRSVKIADDERGGWSSDRPRRGGGPQRPPDISVRCRVLTPSDELRYSPGSLLLVASASAERRDGLVDRVIGGGVSVLSLERVRRLLEGRVADDEVDARAPEVLDAAVRKRLEANEAIVVTGKWLDPADRERVARLAAAERRPRHLILVEAAADQVEDDDRPGLNDLRTRLDAGDLGAEGFQTALRLGGDSVSELKRIVFAPEPRDD